MAMGRRQVVQQGQLWIATGQLPQSPGHVFYEKLNGLLAEAGFDRWVKDLCRPHDAQKLGRPGIPPGVYLRMLLVWYFEGIGSQRAIAWPDCSREDARRAVDFGGHVSGEAHRQTVNLLAEVVDQQQKRRFTCGRGSLSGQFWWAQSADGNGNQTLQDALGATFDAELSNGPTKVKTDFQGVGAVSGEILPVLA